MCQKYVHGDANSLVLKEQLNYILSRRADLYRPSFFRSFLNVSHDIPSWAEFVEVEQITDFAEFKPINSFQTKFPNPTEEKTSSKVKIMGFGAAYTVKDDELDRAAATGVNVSTSRPIANQKKAEHILESIAAVGYSPTGLLGLLNQTDVDTMTLITKAAGGVTWAVATAGEIVADCNRLLYTLYSGSKQLYEGTTIVLPVTRYGTMAEKRNSSTDRTALELFKAQHPNVKIVPWHPCETAGAGDGTRMVAFAANAPEVATMLIPLELRDTAPIREHLGFSVAQIMKTAGVLCQVPEGILYADGL